MSFTDSDKRAKAGFVPSREENLRLHAGGVSVELRDRAAGPVAGLTSAEPASSALQQAAGVVLDASAHGEHLLNSLRHRGLIALKIAEKVGEPGIGCRKSRAFHLSHDARRP